MSFASSAFTFFYRCLWLTLNLLVDLAMHLRNVYMHTCKQYRLLMDVFRNKDHEMKFARVMAKSWRKKPEHITILLPSSGDYLLTDLVNLVYWAIGFRIPYISFYDSLGLLRKREEDLIQQIRQKLHTDQHLIWHNKETRRNGLIGAKIHVKILEASRDAMVTACRTLIREKCEDWSVQSVDECLRRNYEFPDPQLCLYEGPNLNLEGAPAWQMHLTEFVPVMGFERITLWDFVSAMERFQVCQQRGGK